MYKGAITLVLTIFIYIVNGQANVTDTIISLGPPSTPSAVAPSPVSQTTQPTQTIQQPMESIIPCSAGNSIGYMILHQPNISSLVTTASMYNVSYDFSVAVTKPPTYLDVYLQLVATGVRTTWSNKIASKVPTDPRWFQVKIDGVVQGKYQIRLVPDGKETFNVPANQLPCFANGEAIPSVSAIFSVSNPSGDLANYPDRYPANGSKKSKTTSISILVGTVLLIWTWW